MVLNIGRACINFDVVELKVYMNKKKGVCEILGFHMILVLVRDELTNGFKLGLQSLNLESLGNPFLDI